MIKYAEAESIAPVSEAERRRIESLRLDRQVHTAADLSVEDKDDLEAAHQVEEA